MTIITGIHGEESDVTRAPAWPLDYANPEVIVEVTEGPELIVAHLTMHAAQRLIEELQAAIDGAE